MFLVARNRNSAQRREEIIPLRVALTKPAGYHPRLGQTRQKWTCTCVTLVREPEPENVSRLSLMKEQLLPGVSDASFCLKKTNHKWSTTSGIRGLWGKGEGRRELQAPWAALSSLLPNDALVHQKEEVNLRGSQPRSCFAEFEISFLCLSHAKRRK